jgi:dienelactone hydrolase
MAKQRVSFESYGRELQGRLFVPASASGYAVLFVHGFGARGRTCEQYAKKIAQLGVISLTFDLSGHGDSEGRVEELSLNNNVDDVCSAYDYLASRAGSLTDSSQIKVAGMSYGGNLAVIATTRKSITSLLLRSPPLYPKLLFDKPRGLYTVDQALIAKPELDNPALKAIQEFDGNVSLAVSEFDELVPGAVTDAYNLAAKNCTITIIKGASHSFDAAAQEQFQPLVSLWATSS